MRCWKALRTNFSSSLFFFSSFYCFSFAFILYLFIFFVSLKQKQQQQQKNKNCYISFTFHISLIYNDFFYSNDALSQVDGDGELLRIKWLLETTWINLFRLRNHSWFLWYFKGKKSSDRHTQSGANSKHIKGTQVKYGEQHSQQ